MVCFSLFYFFFYQALYLSPFLFVLLQDNEVKLYHSVCVCSNTHWSSWVDWVWHAFAALWWLSALFFCSNELLLVVYLCFCLCVCFPAVHFLLLLHTPLHLYTFTLSSTLASICVVTFSSSSSFFVWLSVISRTDWWLIYCHLSPPFFYSHFSYSQLSQRIRGNAKHIICTHLRLKNLILSLFF